MLWSMILIRVGWIADNRKLLFEEGLSRLIVFHFDSWRRIHVQRADKVVTCRACGKNEKTLLMSSNGGYGDGLQR